MIKMINLLNEDFPRMGGIYTCKNSFGKGTSHFFAFGDRIEVVKIGMGEVKVKLLGYKNGSWTIKLFFRELDKYFRWLEQAK